MQVTQSYAFGSPNVGPGGGGGYNFGSITKLIAAAADPNPAVYKATNNDYTIEADASNQNIQIVLPAASKAVGQIKTIKRIDASYASGNSVTILAVDGSTIEGLSSIALTAQSSVVKVQSDGTQWIVNSGQNSAPFPIPATPGAIAAITVGASPFTYTATQAGTVYTSAGTVSALQFKRGATTIDTGIVDGPVPVDIGDKVIVTYSVAPTMNFAPI
ncbi:hypothetical protein [Burkholderia mayonis]|uniref:Uncharacterized protein n=1 Tax=Burkholderia mayonis TaxID=1385591 RepID=A0A1B4G364_9BURK|nr:hypothetical protein [Burkholderia mayonis]AOJ10345.1 hypothetical protein WS71_24355 [Burkholderia mayonis]KVE53673.1 hypothetical protein WS71_06415 [Burkholderia mayonis]